MIAQNKVTSSRIQVGTILAMRNRPTSNQHDGENIETTMNVRSRKNSIVHIVHESMHLLKSCRTILNSIDQ